MSQNSSPSPHDRSSPGKADLADALPREVSSSRPGLLQILLGAAVLACSCFSCAGGFTSLLPSAPGIPPVIQAPQVLWRVNLADHGFLPRFGALELASPELLEGGGSLIIGSSSGEVVRVNLDHGTILWRTRLAGAVMSRCMVDGNVLVVSHDGGSLDRLDLDTGQILWQHPLKSVVRTTPLLAGGRLFFTSEEETLYALDVETGKWLWEYHREPPNDFTIAGIAPPILAGGGVVAGFADGTVVSLQPEDGSLRWSKHLVQPGKQFPDIQLVTVLFGERLFVSSIGGGLFEMSASDGEILWHQPALEGVVQLAPQGSDLIASTGEGEVVGVGSTEGRVLWKQTFGGGAIRALMPHGPHLLASSAELGILVLRPEDGAALARYNPGEGVSSGVAIVGDRLFFLTNGGYLYGVLFP